MKNKKGYSLIVLVIAIAVILIISSSAITMLKTSREDINITNFIYDLRTVEEQVLQYYSETGMLPVNLKDKLLITNTSISNEQISERDNENYYDIDLGRLKIATLKDEERGYIINEKSLKIYVKTPTIYKGSGYYTLTSELVNNKEYDNQSTEYIIIGNPKNWVGKAEIRISIPTVPNEEIENWEFMYEYGAKTAEYFESLTNAQKANKKFNYGETIECKSNGSYSIYIKKNTETPAEIVNVVVNKVDDIKPKITVNLDSLKIEDSETGIKTICYKTIAEVEANMSQATLDPDREYTNLDYYLLNDKGEDIFTIPTRIAEYKTEKEKLETENKTYNTQITSLEDIKASKTDEGEIALVEEQIQAENERHTLELEILNGKITELETKYPYLLGVSQGIEPYIYVYVEDYAGNASIAGDTEIVNFWQLFNTYGWEV